MEATTSYGTHVYTPIPTHCEVVRVHEGRPAEQLSTHRHFQPTARTAHVTPSAPPPVAGTMPPNYDESQSLHFAQPPPPYQQ